MLEVLSEIVGRRERLSGSEALDQHWAEWQPEVWLEIWRDYWGK